MSVPDRYTDDEAVQPVARALGKDADEVRDD